MKDFSFWEEYKGASEGSGRSSKIWLQNPDTLQTGLFKYKKDIETTDHVSECIAYQLATLLDIPCAKYELGTYQGNEGSISYNIIDSSDQSLIEGISFITMLYPDYDPEKFIAKSSQHYYSIEMIVNAIQKFVSIDGFLNMLIFDFLIGNSDRHQNNWAIISNQTNKWWSPLYDNGSSLCAFIKDDQIDGYLGKDLNRWNALIDTKSKSMIRCTTQDQKHPTQLEVIKYLKTNYFNKIKPLAEKICDILNQDNLNKILNNYPPEILSDKKKFLIYKFLSSKKQLLASVYLD